MSYENLDGKDIDDLNDEIDYREDAMNISVGDEGDGDDDIEDGENSDLGDDDDGSQDEDEDEVEEENEYDIVMDNENEVEVNNNDIENISSEHQFEHHLQSEQLDQLDETDPSNPLTTGTTRQSRRQVVRRNYLEDVSGENNVPTSADDQNLTSINHFSSNSSIVIKALDSLTKYFTDRLYQVIFLLQGTEEMLRQWTVQLVLNERGLLSGLIDVNYLNNHKRCRHRVDVACSLGLMTAAKITRNLSREQLYLIAMEFREKHLISQLLGSSNGLCDEIRYVDDNATILYNGEIVGIFQPKEDLPGSILESSNDIDILPESVSIMDVPNGKSEADTSRTGPTESVDSLKSENDVRKRIYFAFGNVIILSWGNIIPNPAFSNASYIYPVGFKCLRQEYDVALDRIVECLCEIVAYSTESNSILQFSDIKDSTVQTIYPLFRLTVAWIIKDGERVVRVYEAKSPQSVWQAAMTETVGIDSKSSSFLKSSVPTTVISQLENCDVNFEPMDDEERLLRNRIIEERKHYFRCLKVEQRKGIQAALVPRLSIDNAESFVDEGVMRLIEGMQNALDCENYSFVDSREFDGGRRNIWRGYNLVNDKLKVLHKVIRKHQHSNYLHGVVISTAMTATAPPLLGKSKLAKKRKGEYGDKRGSKLFRSNRKFKRWSKIGLSDGDMSRESLKDQRLQMSTFLKARSIFVRQLESNIVNMRNNMMKLLKKRRDELKYVIGGVSDREYQFSRNQNSILPESENGNLFFGPSTAGTNVSLPLPEPESGFILYDGNLFADILELWDFLQTFSEPLNLTDFNDTIPNLIKFYQLLKRCDPHVKRIIQYCPEMANSFDYLIEKEKYVNDYSKLQKVRTDNLREVINSNTEKAPEPSDSNDSIQRSKYSHIETCKHEYSQVFDYTEDEVNDTINTIGITITNVLLKEYEQVMGMSNIADPVLSSSCSSVSPFFDSKVTVNELTWREISRTVLITMCARELGISEVDISGSLKGKGYSCSPETTDKKALRLIKRRMIYQYAVKHEILEQLHGFQCGISIRIPKPSCFMPNYSYLYVNSHSSANQLQDAHLISRQKWIYLLIEVQQIPNSYYWLIFDVISVAIMICTDSNARTELKALLNSNILGNAFVPSVKEAIQKILSGRQLSSISTSNNILFESSRAGIISANGSIEEFPSAPWDLLRRQFLFQYLHAKPNQVVERAKANVDGEIEEDPDFMDILSNSNSLKDKNAVNADDLDEKMIADEIESNVDTIDDGISKSPSPFGIPFVEESVVSGDFKLSTANAAASARSTRSNFRQSLNSEAVVSEFPSANIPYNGNALMKIKSNHNPSDIAKLSEAMKRCLICVLELMDNQLASPFYIPVDPKQVPNYYNYIAQPISLSEICDHLVMGLYHDNILSFYTDMMLLLQNALAFNTESSSIHQAALKLVIIFERLFYEIVLSWNNPLPHSQACHACRLAVAPSMLNDLFDAKTLDASIEVSYTGASTNTANFQVSAGTKFVSCERCESIYHLNCLDPPLAIAPRNDWYCAGCIENRGITLIHPNKLSRVYHPHPLKYCNNVSNEAAEPLYGQVIGVAQIRQKVQFTIQFDNNYRELWDGDQVREYTRSKDHSLIDVCDELEYGIPSLPSGYSYEHFDLVCGLAKGYTGWGSYCTLIPTYLSDSHSLLARKRSLTDPFFQSSRLALAWLGASPLLVPEDMGAREITTVFKALFQRTMSSSAFIQTINKLDETNGHAIMKCGRNISKGIVSFENLIKGLNNDYIFDTDETEEDDNDAEFDNDVDPLDLDMTVTDDGTKSNIKSKSAGTKSSNALSSSKPSSKGKGIKKNSAVKTSNDADANNDKTKSTFSGILKLSKTRKSITCITSEAEYGKTVTSKDSRASKKLKFQNDDEDELFESDEDTWRDSSQTFSLSKPRGLSRGSSIESIESLDLDEEKDNDMDVDVDNDSDADILEGVDTSLLDSMESSRLVSVSPFPESASNTSTHSPQDEDSSPIVDTSSGDLEEIQWEHRRYSRRKGREDALANHALLVQVMNQAIDLHGKGEKEAYGNTLVEALGDYYVNAAVPAIVKVCSMKPSDDVNVDEWTRGFQSKSSELFSPDYLSKSTQLCGYCGQDEYSVCSSFVYSQTWNEYLESKLESQKSSQQTDIDLISSNTSKENVSVSKTGKRRVKYSKSLASKSFLWKPCYPPDAEIEREEGELVGRVFQKGSLVVHENCAEMMVTFRAAALQRTQRNEMTRIIDIIAGIGRGKTTSVGHDADGNVYWVFDSIPGVFVSSRRSDMSSSDREISGCREILNGQNDDTLSLSKVFVGISNLNPTEAAKEAERDMDTATHIDTTTSSAPHTISQLAGYNVISDDDVVGDGSKVEDKWSTISIHIDKLRYRNMNPWEYYTSDFKAFPALKLNNGGAKINSQANFTNNMSPLWRFYKSEIDIQRLIDRLDHKLPQERILKQTLKLLFPATVGPDSQMKKSINEAIYQEETANSGILNTDNSNSEGTTSNEILSDSNDTKNESFIGGDKNKLSKVKLEVNDMVIVQGNNNSNINLYKAKIIEVSTRIPNILESAVHIVEESIPIVAVNEVNGDERTHSLYYKVSFADWSREYDSWIPERNIIYKYSELSTNSVTNMSNRESEDAASTTADLDMISQRLSQSISHVNQISNISSVRTPLTGSSLLPDVRNLKIISEDYSVSSNSSRTTGDVSVITNPNVSEDINHLIDSIKHQNHQNQGSSMNSSLIRSLKAYIYHKSSYRATNTNSEFSDAEIFSLSSSSFASVGINVGLSTSFDTVKYCMLMVFHALPLGSIDDSDERWNTYISGGSGNSIMTDQSFTEIWKESLILSSDVSSLMQCMLMLEYGIRTPWLSPVGLKVMSCLPSRIHCLRYPTLGLIALKLFTLDNTIRYDKITYPKGLHHSNSQVNNSQYNSQGNKISKSSKKR